MDENSRSLEIFSRAVQEAALPAVWSRGVALTRNTEAVSLDSEHGGELKLSVITPDRAVHPKITLWIGDAEWHCTCGDRNDPCPHVCAAAIALKAGRIIRESATRPRLLYRFISQDGRLRFERRLVIGNDERELRESLTSLVGGIQSGRIALPAPAASPADFKVDALLSATSEPAPAALLEALEDLSFTLDGASARASRKKLGFEIVVEDSADGGWWLRLKSDEQSDGLRFSNGYVFAQGTLRPLEILTLPDDLRARIEAGYHVPRIQGAQLTSQLLPELRRYARIRIDSSRLPQNTQVAPRVVLKTTALDGMALSVLPLIVYSDATGRLAVVQENELALLQNAKIPVRDLGAERVLERRLQSELHLKLGVPTRFERASAVAFSARAAGGDWEIEGKGSTEFVAERTLVPRVVEKGADWTLDFGPGAEADAVLAAWRRGDVYVSLSGAWVELPVQWLQKHGAKLEALLRARALHGHTPAAFVTDLSPALESAGAELPERLKVLRARLEGRSAIPEARLPSDLAADLRPYQRDGVNWLSFLRESGMGALLADDMGLGKTLQAICVLRGRALVVAPTSVLIAWKEQLARFRPGVRVHVYHGTHREWPAKTVNDECQVLLTTYGMLRQESERFGAETWDTAVLDEAQTIKNPDSQVARAAHGLKAAFRIALSGTPIENREDDLWSQFQFLNPGWLGSRGMLGESAASGKLAARVRPFTLRRMKREVAPELPARTETVLHCELSGEERAVYDAVLAATRKDLVARIEGASPLAILEALLRLRQACCHSALLPGQAARTSSKLELLAETLSESIENGHRVLVFSQWTSLLDLIGARLNVQGLQHDRLDGSTRDREGVVARFQDLSGPPILLMSLKAGGVGITLTAADHVIIADPWWNPAAEDQAADRAHRIGQTQPVLIQRLVARDTVEEKILALQASKKALSARVLSGASGGESMPTLDELRNLLSSSDV